MSSEDSYILGLWCADGYHRTSSIGLSNINEQLIKRFSEYLLGRFDKSRLRLRVYVPECYHQNITLDRWNIERVSVLKVSKAKNPAYHVYVNSRPLLKEFREKRKYLLQMEKDIFPYFAGRFDGDGSVDRDGRKDCRIVYGSQNEVEVDQLLLKKARPNYLSKIYWYQKSGTYCLYISRYDSEDFIKNLMPHSTVLKEKFLTP